MGWIETTVDITLGSMMLFGGIRQLPKTMDIRARLIAHILSFPIILFGAFPTAILFPFYGLTAAKKREVEDMNWNILDKNNQLPKVAILTFSGELYILGHTKDMTTNELDKAVMETVPDTRTWGEITQIKLGELKR